ncbi:hypothetical protein [Christiangramia sp. OXR-203]|uniref:hypothetical protein n=1 Tax=Christiangramia sp. OXR-203 TaxID=3100176 RepID=UPI002AC9B5B0|nr:hypothetical protein [Christiangramia sp. OXR-203]WPY97920.1 hypothetical protein T8I65_12145 [Christiangramia sp. OXR-203]
MFGVWGLGFGVWGLGFGVGGWLFVVCCLWFVVGGLVWVAIRLLSVLTLKQKTRNNDNTQVQAPGKWHSGLPKVSRRF